MSHQLVQKSSSFLPPVPKPTINSAPHFQPVQQKATPNAVVQKKSSPQQQVASEKAMWDNMRSGLQVQAKCAECGGEETNHSPTQIAATGFTGSPVPLPHLERIQRSFGQDLSHVQAYIGGPAAAASKQLGAQAYTMGNKIAFQKPPGVELSAHEGTHVLQQQSGKVQLSGEMGKVGDKYEVEADAVGAKVAAGESVRPLLQKYSQGNSLQVQAQAGTSEQLQKKSLGNEQTLENQKASGNDPQQLAHHGGVHSLGSLEIRFKPVATPITPIHHAFVILRQPAYITGGAITHFYRGGPAKGGHIRTQYGRYKPKTVDWTTTPSGVIHLKTIDSLETWKDYDRSLTATMKNIQAARIKYGYPSGRGCSGGANSNSTAYQAIRNLGITPPTPPVHAPCYEIDPLGENIQRVQVPETDSNTEVAVVNTQDKNPNSSI